MTWARVLDAHTPAAQLPAIVDGLVARSMNELAWQLEQDGDLSETDRAALLAFAAPLVRAKTRETIETAWLQFQPRQ